ncbi:hypothetical protein PIB30_040488 [Stylosanthes scabra]|uniref:HTH myb-type domain-containing protein n=1 Tax=Stylosanthes scabra TaxID=79078 RepID=A0ABU6ZDA9_9FABA|nr:hypothetical protein [Stylosanthes scabra]
MLKKASSLHKLKPIKRNNHRMPPSNEKPVPHLESEPILVPAPALAPTPVPEPIPMPDPALAPAPAVTAAPALELAPLDSEGEGEIPTPSSPPSSIKSSSTNSGGSKSRKRKSSEMNNSSEGESSGPKHKKKVTWTNGLHNRFLVAIRHIGLDKAVPKKILEIMNVPNLTRENIASHLQKYRIFLRKVTEKGILGGLSERTLRSKFAAELPIDMIKEMQESVEKLNNTKIFIPTTTPLMQALLGRSYPLFYTPNNNNNNGVAPTYPNNTQMYPQNYAQPPPPMGINNNNNNLQNQSCYGGPMMYNNQIQNYAQLPLMGNNSNYQHQSYDLGMGNMVSMGNPNNINNNNMPFMNDAPPSYYPNYTFGGEILGVHGHGGLNNNGVGVGGGGGGATTPIPISNNNYNNSNVNGFGFMGGANIQNSNNNINGNYPPAMVQGYYAPPQPPTPPAGGGGFYAAPPPPPAAAVINNNGIDIMRKHAGAQNNSGGSFSSQSSVTTVSAGNSADQPIQVDDNVLSNLFFMLEDMRLLQQSEQAAKNQEINNAFFMPANFMPANSSTCSNVMQSPYQQQQVGGNQVPDDFFDFCGSANVMQQTRISGDVIVPSAENIMNLQTQLPITTNDYTPIQASIYTAKFY